MYQIKRDENCILVHKVFRPRKFNVSCLYNPKILSHIFFVELNFSVSILNK